MIVCIIVTLLLLLAGFALGYSFKNNVRAIGEWVYANSSKSIKRLIYRVYGIALAYKNRDGKVSDTDGVIHPILNDEQKESIDSATKITFVGDLILLKQMVENGYEEQTGTFKYEGMFEHVREIIQDSDFSIGVFEGPVADKRKGYSTSNYGDGIPIYLNFPKAFATAVRNAGFNLITTANNHLLDQGVIGAMQTLDALDEIGLDHIGSYRNEVEHNAIRIYNVNGLRVGILAYTYGSNYYDTSFFFKEENRYLTDVIVDKRDDNYKKSKEKVERDFKRLKENRPDIIVVLPHMGKQFRHIPDDMQRHWCNIFIELGADVIFSCHPHAVQPIEWRKKEGKNVLIVHCPGNYVNSYTDNDGDASMIVEAYIAPTTHRLIASSCIPICTYAKQGEVFTGLPTYKAFKDGQIRQNLSSYDYRRIQQVQRLVTRVALGGKVVDEDQAQKRYYLLPDHHYYRMPILSANIKDGECKGIITRMIEEAQTVCFIGDSITEGTRNGGYGWFEPMMSLYPGKQWYRLAKGGCTTSILPLFVAEIDANTTDLVVVAIGCNDIRYRNDKTCAMTATEYTKRLESFVGNLQKRGSKARFVFISPFESMKYDPFCNCKEEKKQLYTDYCAELHRWCIEKGHVFIDPNPYINNVREKYCWDKYMKDHIHPTADKGIELFSEAIMSYTN